MPRRLALLLALLALPLLARGQDAPPRLLGEPVATYPDEARRRGLHGVVELLVTVDADGAVVAVEVVEGHELLVPAASAAARELRYEPARDDGAPIQATVPLTIRFSPHDDTPSITETVEVVGTREEESDEPATISTVDEAALRRARGKDLADTLESVAGVTVAKGTAAVGKPVVRGQAERRLLLLDDGVPHASQKWGADHAPEVDPQAAGRIRVVKGAAGVRYGPDAVGGVVIVEPRPMPLEPGVHGAVDLVGQTNGLGLHGGGRIEGMLAALPGLSARIEGNVGAFGPRSTPDYVLGNTASRTWNLGASVQYARPGVQLRVSYRHYDLRAGIFFGVRSSTATAFAAGLEADSPPGADAWTRDWTIERPYQSVQHDRVAVHANLGLNRAGSLEVVGGFQVNHRREFDQVRASVQGPQYDFVLRTTTLELGWEQPRLPVGVAFLTGRVGVAGLYQEHEYGGRPLLPNHRAGAVGLFAHERLTFPRGVVEAGVRWDHMDRSAFFTDSDYERHLARGTLDPQDCNEVDGVGRCPFRYDAVTATVGGLLHAVPEVLDLQLDLASGSRAPSSDELYLNGTSPTFPVYALGKPDLGIETAWGVTGTVTLEQPWLHLEVSPHLTYIDDYIQFAPERGADGELAIDVTIRGAFPRYSYRSLNAWFYGVDGHAELGGEGPVALVINGALVRGRAASDGEHLVGVPPDRLELAARLQPRRLGPLRDLLVEVSAGVVGSVRGYTDPKLDLAPYPAPYALVGAALGARVPLPRGAGVEVQLEVENLVNTRYRDTLSLLRYYADEPGRNVRLRVGFDF